ncbi:MAG: hypothetical protein A2107_06560 [Verrucomicrobia bacterium GWF2_62_7]|nr:MAG: hypothetical protein A2107_06560 [Verrucomicrobia bacterium GWF2_62_7]
MGYKQLTTKTVTLAVAALIGAGAAAQANDAILDLLVKKGVVTQREANDIREQADAENAKTIEQFNKVKTASWIDMLTLSGDFRLRTEYFDFERGLENSPPPLNAADRLRFRMRLRLGAEMKLQDWATVGVRLTSGENTGGPVGLNTTPISANQTFTDDFSRKPIGIDLAYVTVHPPALDWFRITGGKMPWQTWEPKFASMMAQDPDVNPEGIAEVFEYKFGSKQQYKAFLNAGQYSLMEFSKDQNDIYLFDQEIGLEAKLNDRWKATVAGGYYGTKNLALNPVPTASPNAGNATRTSGGTFYLDDFNVWYGRGEVVWHINDKTFLGTPNIVTVSGEYMKNVSPGYKTLRGANTNIDRDQTEGWTGQVAFGDTKKAGQWKLSYQYKRLEADSTIDMFTDDDFSSGGTDRKGHVIEGAYMMKDWWSFRMIAFLTDKISDRPNTGHNTLGFHGQDFARFQFDTMFKF